MKFTFTSVRWLLLLVGVSILTLETIAYYQARLTLQSPSETELSGLLQPSPVVTPTALPSPKAVPLSFETQLDSFMIEKIIDRPLIEAAQTSFVGQTLATDISQVEVYLLQYRIVGRDGAWKPITARVYIPVSDQLASESYPLYVFGSGTTGMADKCAPSLEEVAIENLGNYENHMIAQAAAGYVAVFPDYEGFNDPDATQAYFIVESEAKTLLGAINNLYQLRSEPEVANAINFDEVFLGGYSQGGHAALSAAQYWTNLPPAIRLRGVLQFAGAADVEALFFDSPHLAAYLAESFVAYYQPELDSAPVLQDKWLAEMARNNETLCVNAAYRYYPSDPNAVYAPAFLDAISSGSWPTTFAAWQLAIQQNIPLTNLPNVPYLSVQGETDPIVTAETQFANFEQLCEQDKTVTYRVLPQVNHFQIRQESFVYSDNWMKQVLAGQSVENDCGVVTPPPPPG